MKPVYKSLPVLLYLLLFCELPLTADSVAQNRAEWRQINTMILTKSIMSNKNPAAMAAEQVVFYFDSNNRLRKMRHFNPGADGAGELVQYFRADGSAAIIQWFEGVNEMYRFQGTLHLDRRGRFLRKGSYMEDSWTATPARKLQDAALKRYGTRGHGNYIAWFVNAAEARKAFRYPKKFQSAGTVRFRWVHGKWLRTAGHGATVRSAPTVQSTPLVRLPAGASVEITADGTPSRLPGWGVLRWYKTVCYLNGKEYKGWIFGGLIEPEEQALK